MDISAHSCATKGRLCIYLLNELKLIPSLWSSHVSQIYVLFGLFVHIFGYTVLYIIVCAIPTYS